MGRWKNAAKLIGAALLSWAVLEGLAFGVLALWGDEGSGVRDSGAAGGDGDWLTQARLGFEGGLYQWDEHTLWRLAPGYRSPSGEAGRRFWGRAGLVLNEHGMRGPPVPVAKPTGVHRVLILGGSHPMGMYVEYEQSYGAVLERKLNALGAGRWQVVNASAPGYTSWQGRQLLEHGGADFEPDIVIADLGVNDTLPLSTAFPLPDKEVRRPPHWAERTRSLLERSAVYRLLRRLLSWRPNLALQKRVSPEDHAANVRAMRALGQARGFRVLAVSQVMVETGGNGRARCIMREDDLEPYVDLCALFEDLGAEAGRLFVDPIHANPEGHALIADAILDTLQAEGWVPRGAP